MARYALEFLNWAFKHDSSAEMYLKNSPAKNGVPDHMLLRISVLPSESAISFGKYLGRTIQVDLCGRHQVIYGEGAFPICVRCANGESPFDLKPEL
jgi:hypothetical protein